MKRTSRVDAPFSRRHFLGASVVGAGSMLLGRTWPGGHEVRAAERERLDLIVRSKMPLNAEPTLDKLLQDWITPVSNFYVRNHAPVPKIDAASFRLSVDGLVQKPLELTTAELQQKFFKSRVTATMTCAGNRREEHSRIKPVGGVQWGAGAIGNAHWGGAKLKDVLQAAGIKEGARHVWFEGVDEHNKSGETIIFGGSIPLEKALAEGEMQPPSLVCWEMNDAPLTPEHGFPLRTVVPGYIGARSVKWLGRIVVSDRPSENHYLATAYKLVTEDSEAQWKQADALYEFPVNGVICVPGPGVEVAPGRARVSGYALPQGTNGATVKKVEVSGDGGRRWVTAKLRYKAMPFCWNLWDADVPVTAQTRELIVRATDSEGRTQPERVDWNLKGYMFNAWHRVPIDPA